MNNNSPKFAIDYKVTNSWNNGFIGNVNFTNQGNRLKDWTISFETKANIEHYWNADLISKKGNKYTFKAVDWNDDLQQGERVTLGFKGKGNKSLIPYNFSVNGQSSFASNNQSSQKNLDIGINYKVTNSWSNGFIGNVNFTNEGNSLEDWTISFKTKANIEHYWNAELVSKKGDRYTFKAADWNDNLRPGASVTLGFKGTGNQSLIPYDYIFNGQSLSTPQTKISKPEPKTEGQQTPNFNKTSNQLSSNAISQSFESHSDGTKYVRNVQSEDWNVQWSVDSQMSKFAEITNDEAFSGNKSLRVTHRPDQRSQGNAAWALPEKDVYYLSYRVKFEKGFDFDGDSYSGGKLPGLASSDGWCSGGQTCNGSNGFTSRYMWDKGGKGKLYLYHMDKPGKWGESIFFEDISGQDVYFKPGKWHQLTQRVEINDGNQKNGSIDVWMDGKQVLDVNNLRLVNNGSGIDSLNFSVFHGGSGSGWYPDREVYSYYDDFVVSTNPADVGL